jgi:hypothetical protein
MIGLNQFKKLESDLLARHLIFLPRTREDSIYLRVGVNSEGFREQANAASSFVSLSSTLVLAIEPSGLREGTGH